MADRENQETQDGQRDERQSRQAAEESVHSDDSFLATVVPCPIPLGILCPVRFV